MSDDFFSETLFSLVPILCLLLLLQQGGDTGILIKYCALGDWKFKNIQVLSMMRELIFKIFFLKSQNVCFLKNSEMCCDNNDLFMILNLFFKNVSVFCVVFFLFTSESMIEQ